MSAHQQEIFEKSNQQPTLEKDKDFANLEKEKLNRNLSCSLQAQKQTYSPISPLATKSATLSHKPTQILPGAIKETNFSSIRLSNSSKAKQKLNNHNYFEASYDEVNYSKKFNANSKQAEGLDINANISYSGQDQQQQKQKEEPPNDDQGTTYKLSKRRWVILLGMCIYGFSNGVTNELYSILHTLVELMEIPIEEYMYLLQIFCYIVPVLGLPTAWFVDRYGFRKSIYISLFFAGVRNLARALLFSPNLMYWKELRFLYWFTHNILLQFVVLMYYCLPLKVSESWFSSSERSIAWSLMITMPMLGAACAALTVPNFVRGPHSVHPLAWVNIVWGLISTVAILFSVTRSKPEHPPSLRAKLNEKYSSPKHSDNNNNNNSRSSTNESAPVNQNNNNNNQSKSLLKNLKHLISDKNVIIHIVLIACFDSFIVCINNILQDVLSASGFTSLQTGRFLATMFIASAALQTYSSFQIKEDEREGAAKKEEEESSSSPKSLNHSTEDQYAQKARKCKIYMSTNCITFLLYTAALSLRDYPEQQWWLAIAASLAYTLLRFWAVPTYIDVLAHLISGSISQPIACAFQMTSQALATVCFSVIFVALRRVDNNGQPKTPDIILQDLSHGANATDSIYDIENNVNDVDVILELGRPNYLYSIMFLASVAVVFTLIYVIFFDGKKREHKCSPSSKELGQLKEAQIRHAAATAGREASVCATKNKIANRTRIYSTASLPLDLSMVSLIGKQRRPDQHPEPITFIA